MPLTSSIMAASKALRSGLTSRSEMVRHAMASADALNGWLGVCATRFAEAEH